MDFDRGMRYHDFDLLSLGEVFFDDYEDFSTDAP
jgi:hypothetical protein